jgi:hypothetical protein
MKNTRFTFCILSLIATLAGGCVGPKPLSDPMSGWTRLPDRDQPDLVTGYYPVGPDDLNRSPVPHQPDRDQKVDKSVIEYCQSYAHSLQAEGYSIDVGSIWFYQNGSGQLAAIIDFLPINNTPPSEQLAHVLIYDKNNKRIRVIKYRTGWYSY